MPRLAHIARIIAAGTRNRLRFALGRVESLRRSAARQPSVEEERDYVQAVFDDFVRYGRLTGEQLRGANVLELGPGGNIGVGLLMLAHGARRYQALDKFYSAGAGDHERKVYELLRRDLNNEQRTRFDRAVRLAPELEFNGEYVQSIHGADVKDLDGKVESGSVDLILSRAVLQEVREIDGAFDAMERALKPGGRMLHKIDFRDWGMFSDFGFHPLEFLTVSRLVYALMAHNSVKPNRRLIDYYRRRMEQAGYEFELLITSRVPVKGHREDPMEILPHKARLERGVDYTDEHLQMVEAVRPRLAAPYRELSDEDLLTAGVFLVARAPSR